MKTLISKLVRDEQGGEVLEYALIAGLIVVAAIGKADELLGLSRKRKQPFAEDHRNRGITRAMHDQQRRCDPRNALVGTERISHQQTDWEDRKG